MHPEFWQGRRVLVTGHTGFKGSWLCLWLEQLGAQVGGIALAPESPSLFEQALVAGSMESLEGDVRDLPALKTLIAEQQPEIVIHMAAQSLVRPSYRYPVETYATNVMGTVHVLEAVRHEPSVRAVLVVTSDKCYENLETIWGYREHDPFGGHDPYSSSKGCAEIVTAAYRRSFFSAETGAVAVASVRAGNVIGGGDWCEDRLLPDIFKALLAGRSPQIRNPHATRPWQHVLDALHAYLILARRLFEDGREYAQGWNIGPLDGDTRPVSWIAEQITSRWQPSLPWQDTSDPTQPHEAALLTLDSTQARARLGWQPALDVEEALTWVVSWYQGCRDGADLRTLTVQQICDFQERVEQHSLSVSCP